MPTAAWEEVAGDGPHRILCINPDGGYQRIGDEAANLFRFSDPARDFDRLAISGSDPHGGRPMRVQPFDERAEERDFLSGTDTNGQEAKFTWINA
jgi:hypothetical protein